MADGRSDSGQPAVVAILMVIAVLVLVGVLYVTGVFGPRRQVVELEVPEVEAPAVPRPTTPDAPGDPDAN